MCVYYRSSTAFERSKTDVFRVKTNNVGQIKKIRYPHNVPTTLLALQGANRMTGCRGFSVDMFYSLFTNVLLSR